MSKHVYCPECGSAELWADMIGYWDHIEGDDEPEFHACSAEVGPFHCCNCDYESKRFESFEHEREHTPMPHPAQMAELFSIHDWRAEVASGETLDSYADWQEAMIRQWHTEIDGHEVAAAGAKCGDCNYSAPPDKRGQTCDNCKRGVYE